MEKQELMVPEKKVQANLIATILDIGISVLLGAVIIGKVALPTFFAVSTAGFDAYTILIWGIMPLVIVAAWLTATYNRAKFAYEKGGSGGY